MVFMKSLVFICWLCVSLYVDVDMNNVHPCVMGHCVAMFVDFGDGVNLTVNLEGSWEVPGHIRRKDEVKGGAKW